MVRTFFGRKTPKAAAITYAAGLFDGEGSVIVGNSGEFCLKIEMSDFGPIEFISKHFGSHGEPTAKRVNRPNAKPTKVISFQGYEGLWFAKAILPQMRNAKHIVKIKWIFAHWNDYASRKNETGKKPRWKMRADFVDHMQMEGIFAR